MRNDPLSHSFGKNWHPCSQMKDYEGFPYLKVKHASGVRIFLEDDHSLIDAISSWWCKPLGHQHPRIKAAVREQTDRFEHVIFANTTSDLALNLGERLTSHFDKLSRVFYAGDGSTAVEISLKMSLQAQLQSGNSDKNQFAYLENAYHGETMLCFSVSDLGLYKEKYASLLPKNHRIDSLKYEHGNAEKILKAKDIDWEPIKAQLEQIKAKLSGIIVEPVLQGAAGMLIYSPQLLRSLKEWCEENEVHLIADEVLTGLGRTGKAYACDHAGIEPDFLCVMKNLSAGWGPFSAVLTTEKIYQLFYDDYKTGKAFMHSNTYSGYALGMAAALEALKVYEEEDFFHQNNILGEKLFQAMLEIKGQTQQVTNIRQLGAMCAADLVNADGRPFSSEERIGYRVYQEAVKRGALLRPLGNSLYFLPPYNLSDLELEELTEICIQSIKTVVQ